jgi:ABC-type sugar transport system substrate-binding protein
MGAIKIQVGIQCLKKASDAGIRVAGMDSTLPIEDARRGGVELSFAVGSDNYKIGESAAEYAATLLDGKSTEVLVIEGAVGSSAGVLRAKGFKEKLHKLAPQAIVVNSLSGEWDRLRAMNITSDTIQRNPHLGIVFAANDPMALGAVEALKSMNKLEQVAVIGVDGIADARKSIAAGELRATVAQLPYLVGKRTVELAIDVLHGKKVQQNETTETPVLTKIILDGKDAEALRYVR